MFTGIVRAIGHVEERTEGATGTTLVLRTNLELQPGASLAVNGCCLTVASCQDDRAHFQLTGETVARTTLGALEPETAVNLEPPLALGDPVGGHIVLGHVDAVATVVELVRGSGEGMLTIEVPKELLRYMPEKGSLAVDGVSLTIASRSDEGRVSFALVPYTLVSTTIGRLRSGMRVNIEVDPLARYLEALLAPLSKS
jgi:riboflavin synthase